MNRYVIPLSTLTKYYQYDVVIIGTGIAGLYTALSLSSTKKVALICKNSPTESNSNLAQGGLSATLNPLDYKSHIQDTLNAGCGINNQKAVELLVKEGAKHVDKLLDIGVAFDCNQDGKLLVTKEGGHTKRRVLHVKDSTGKEIIRALLKHVQTLEHVDMYTDTFMADIITKDDSVLGISAFYKNESVAFIAPNIVVATGGIGHIYTHTTNDMSATGDGIGAAIRAGIHLEDMAFIQFHPTAFYHPFGSRKFLISEALRGEGAILKNEKGEAFMDKKHPLKDLAPRDIVSRAIIDEINKSHIQNVFLDVTHLNPDYVLTRFPNIYKTCLEAGVDMLKTYIPVRPVEHYMMGGIKTDDCGSTNIKGLYAVGETACTGVHGANRLASNSLLEGLVFSSRIAQKINKDNSNRYIDIDFNLKQEHKTDEIKHILLIDQVKDIMTQDVFVYRKQSQLIKAKDTLKDLFKQYSNAIFKHKEDIIAYNGLLCAIAIVEATLKRKDSIGAHQLIGEDE